MTVVITSPVPRTVADLASEVIIKVENRTSDLTRAYVWLREAILEIASNPDFRNDFDQLEVLGPTYNLTIGTREYEESNIVPTGDLNDATLDIMIWTDPPGNTNRVQLNPSHYQRADRFENTTGRSLPTDWYRFGSKIGFYSTPDKTYQVQARILRQHPIDDANLDQTEILLPRDWDEILILSAAMRGFVELLEYEKAKEIRMILMGDPKYPNRPGMIQGRKKRREREDWRKQKPLAPVRRRATRGVI